MLYLKRKKSMVGLIVLIIIITLVFLFRFGEVRKKTAVNTEIRLLNESDVIPVLIESINDVVYFTGDLTPKTQTIISSEIDAKVIKVLVDEGQVVKVGQILAELDTLDLAQAVMQQEAQVAAARAKYELDLQKMQKQQELFRQGFISKIAYEELTTNYQASLQNYKVQEALLIRSRRQLSNTHIKAPFAGVIYQKSIQPGQLALKNTRLFSLADLNDMEIKAAIPSEHINRLKAGQIALFRVENDLRVFQGVVARVNQVAQSGTRSYLVYVDFPNGQYHLKGGQFIRGEVILHNLGAKAVIPCDAIRDSDSLPFVLALKSGVVSTFSINVLLKNSMLNQCAVSGLSANDRILSGNILSVKVGDRVQILN